MKRPDPEPGFDLAHARVAAAVAQRDALEAELDAWLDSLADDEAEEKPSMPLKRHYHIPLERLKAIYKPAKPLPKPKPVPRPENPVHGHPMQPGQP